jgi:hypothetical protein
MFDTLLMTRLPGQRQEGVTFLFETFCLNVLHFLFIVDKEFKKVMTRSSRSTAAGARAHGPAAAARGTGRGSPSSSAPAAAPPAAALPPPARPPSWEF